ncbi:MAG: peptidoglycan DD-metalloendopeptidase family protein [Oscillospiraceae bacterium]
MKKKQSAGMTGKGFYVALSLCVAMVGAACWYAYSQTSDPQTDPDYGYLSQADHSSGAATTTTTAATTTTTASTTRRTAPATTDVAAILPPRTTTVTTTTVTATTTAPVEQPMMPVTGAVVAEFSNGELVKSSTTGIWQTHNGVDFAASVGDAVVAVADGTVTAIDRDVLWGVCVTVLHHDGVTSRYCGLNEGLSVTAGQIVERGEELGAVGNTNESESAMESHLHFEMQSNDAYIDPMAWLQSAEKH